MSYSCFHFWSQPDTAGYVECLWCGKRIESHVQWPTSTTAPTQPAGDVGSEPVSKSVARRLAVQRGEGDVGSGP